LNKTNRGVSTKKYHFNFKWKPTDNLQGLYFKPRINEISLIAIHCIQMWWFAHFCRRNNGEKYQNLTLFKTKKRRYHPHYWSHKGLKSIVVNRIFPSIDGGSHDFKFALYTLKGQWQLFEFNVNIKTFKQYFNILAIFQFQLYFLLSLPWILSTEICQIVFILNAISVV